MDRQVQHRAWVTADTQTSVAAAGVALQQGAYAGLEWITSARLARRRRQAAGGPSSVAATCCGGRDAHLQGHARGDGRTVALDVRTRLAGDQWRRAVGC